VRVVAVRPRHGFAAWPALEIENAVLSKHLRRQAQQAQLVQALAARLAAQQRVKERRKPQEPSS